MVNNRAIPSVPSRRRRRRRRRAERRKSTRKEERRENVTLSARKKRTPFRKRAARSGLEAGDTDREREIEDRENFTCVTLLVVADDILIQRTACRW